MIFLKGCLKLWIKRIDDFVSTTSHIHHLLNEANFNRTFKNGNFFQLIKEGRIADKTLVNYIFTKYFMYLGYINI